MLLTVGTAGCQSTNKWVALRETPRNPLSDTLGLLTKQGPKPTERTVQLLRKYDLDTNLNGDRSALLARLNEIDQQEPSREHLYALAELAYTGAKKAEASNKKGQALEFYGTAVMQSYRYLFDEQYAMASNPYDPQFRRACDLYNASLEGTLRIIESQQPIRPGTSRMIRTANHDCLLEIKLRSKGWHDGDFNQFKFVSDYEIHGLRNHYHFYGLGVPLIAIRDKQTTGDPREQYYPNELCYAVTAFLRIEPPTSLRPSGVKPASHDTSSAQSTECLHAVLELRDPIDSRSVEVAGMRVPLETDMSAPLAFYLSQPSMDDSKLSTLGLLKPEKIEKLQGLYMLEPFRADKIPVVMVHGLWSSPATWMEMFNDLRSDPVLRDNYQFWFYLYPSGQPFWFSATQMREDLQTMRDALDPQRQQPALDQMVLVGHSMGGLVSKLQSVDSGNDFWSVMSEHPFAQLDADPEMKQALAHTFFFDPNPSVQRIVTIGTPHRGSEFSNDFTQWLGRKLIRIPGMIMHGRHQLLARNPDYFRPGAPLDINTSIDSLSPKSPLLPVLLTAEQGPWVKNHNIMGKADLSEVESWLVKDEGDGVVALASAQLDNAASELVVPADHVHVHRHPQAILEVRRILLAHLDYLRHFPYGDAEQGGPLRQAELVEPSAGLPAEATVVK